LRGDEQRADKLAAGLFHGSSNDYFSNAPNGSRKNSLNK